MMPDDPNTLFISIQDTSNPHGDLTTPPRRRGAGLSPPARSATDTATSSSSSSSFQQQRRQQQQQQQQALFLSESILSSSFRTPPPQIPQIISSSTAATAAAAAVVAAVGNKSDAGTAAAAASTASTPPSSGRKRSAPTPVASLLHKQRGGESIVNGDAATHFSDHGSSIKRRLAAGGPDDVRVSLFDDESDFSGNSANPGIGGAAASIAAAGVSTSAMSAFHDDDRRIKVACLPCARSKTKCDMGRPCSRCLKKNMIEQCVDRHPGSLSVSDASTKQARAKAACLPCSQSKTACGSERPCSRCIKMGREMFCIDRPKGLRSKANLERDRPVFINITYPDKRVALAAKMHQDQEADELMMNQNLLNNSYEIESIQSVAQSSREHKSTIQLPASASDSSSNEQPRSYAEEQNEQSASVGARAISADNSPASDPFASNFLPTESLAPLDLLVPVRSSVFSGVLQRCKLYESRKIVDFIVGSQKRWRDMLDFLCDFLSVGQIRTLVNEMFTKARSHEMNISEAEKFAEKELFFTKLLDAFSRSDGSSEAPQPLMYSLESAPPQIDQALMLHARTYLVDPAQHSNPGIILMKLSRVEKSVGGHLVATLVIDEKIGALFGYSQREISWYASECSKKTREFRNRDLVIAPFLWRLVDESYWPSLAIEVFDQFVQNRTETSFITAPLTHRNGSQITCRISYKYVFSESGDLSLPMIVQAVTPIQSM